MGLNQNQKNLVKAWVAAGLKDREIIQLAKEQVPPFHISQQNISKNYRKPVRKKVERLLERQEDSVLRSGLAVRENRIKRLMEYEELARERMKMEKDPKGLSTLINQARGCLDDIAKEMGERREKIDVSANVHIRDIAAIMAKVYGDD